MYPQTATQHAGPTGASHAPNSYLFRCPSSKRITVHVRAVRAVRVNNVNASENTCKYEIMCFNVFYILNHPMMSSKHNDPVLKRCPRRFFRSDLCGPQKVVSCRVTHSEGSRFYHSTVQLTMWVYMTKGYP